MSHDHYKDAKQMLGQLDRATHGDMAALNKVFNYTYGRAGPRRRILLSNVVELLRQSDLAYPHVHPPMFPPPEPRKARKSPDHNRSGNLILPTLEPHPFRTAYQLFLLDQDTNRPGNVLGRNKVRFIDPPIPDKTLWERHVPIKRERGIVQKFVREGLDNCLPPLPEAEWEKLRQISLGEMKPEIPPQRRKQIGTKTENSAMLSFDTIKYGIRHTQLKVLRDRRTERDHHSVTPKFLRRIHHRIFEISPRMEWDSESLRWIYTWGSSPKSKDRQAKVVPRDRQLFSGLEEIKSEDLGGKVELKLPWKERKRLREMAQAEGLEKDGGRGLARLYEAAAEMGEAAVRREVLEDVESETGGQDGGKPQRAPLREDKKIVGGQAMRRILREKRKTAREEAKREGKGFEDWGG